MGCVFPERRFCGALEPARRLVARLRGGSEGWAARRVCPRGLVREAGIEPASLKSPGHWATPSDLVKLLICPVGLTLAVETRVRLRSVPSLCIG